MKNLRRSRALRTLGAGCIAAFAVLGSTMPALADDGDNSSGTTTTTSSSASLNVPTSNDVPLPGNEEHEDNKPLPAPQDENRPQPAPILTVVAAPHCGVKAQYNTLVGRGKIVAFHHNKVGYLESQWAVHNAGTTRANRGTPDGTVVAELFNPDRTPVMYNGRQVVSAPFTVTGCGAVPTLELNPAAACTNDAGMVRSIVSVNGIEQRLLSLTVRTGKGNTSLGVSQNPFKHEIALKAGATVGAFLTFRVQRPQTAETMPLRTLYVSRSIPEMPKCSEPRIVKGAYGTYCTRNGLANPIVRWETDNTVTHRAIAAAPVKADGTLGERTAWTPASQDLLTAPLGLPAGTYRLFAQYTIGGETREQRVDSTDVIIGNRACPIDITPQVSETCTNGKRDVTLTASAHSGLTPRQFKLFGDTTYEASTPAGDLSHTFSVTPGRYWPQIVDNTYNFATSTPVITVPACG